MVDSDEETERLLHPLLQNNYLFVQIWSIFYPIIQKAYQHSLQQE